MVRKRAAYGLEVRDPTQDRRVIELCLAIPNEQYQRGGVDRWLIRRAMRGYLPDEVRLNTMRGLQAADLGQRVLDNRSEFEAALARMEQHELCSPGPGYTSHGKRISLHATWPDPHKYVRMWYDSIARPDGRLILIAILESLW